MSVQGLMVIAGLLILVLAAGGIYLVRRIRRAKKVDDARLDKLSETLLEKLENQPLSEEQKAEIADAIKGIKRS